MSGSSSTTRMRAMSRGFAQRLSPRADSGNTTVNVLPSPRPALDGEPPAVHFDELAADRQAEAATRRRRGPGCASPGGTCRRSVRSRPAGCPTPLSWTATVTHSPSSLAAISTRPPRRSELDPVVHEVDQHARDLVAVGADHERRRTGRRDRHAALFGDRLEGLERLVNERVEPEAGGADLLLAGLDARQVEQLVDQAAAADRRSP